MGSFRLEKVGHLIRELVSEVIRELKDPRIGFAGINEVKISPDLRHAKIYISVFGSDKEKNQNLLIFFIIRTFEKSEPFYLEYSSTVCLSRKRFGFIKFI